MKKILILVFLLVGCSDINRSEYGYEVYEEPPFYFKIPMRNDPCEGIPTDRDMNNCGACGLVCSPANSDRCNAGSCMCGLNPPCGDGEDCRNGQCVSSDLMGKICEFDDECNAGFACIEGRCSFVECVPEECDGIDNDCDGIIDNDGSSPLSKFCVFGDLPVSTLLPPCRPGVSVCEEGSWSDCRGGVQPIPEQGYMACNGSDDDCDGCPDGILVDGYCEDPPVGNYDIVFVVDNSGSMRPHIDIVKRAITLFSGRLTTPNFKWALITVAGEPELVQDLTSLDYFNSSLLMMRIGGSEEPQYDAIYNIANGTIPLNWRFDATRVIILFTDEEGQSRLSDPINESIMCDSMVHGELLIPIAAFPHITDFDDCAFTTANLPPGDEDYVTGSGLECNDELNCEVGELCVENTCTTQAVVDMISKLDSSIRSPCEE